MKAKSQYLHKKAISTDQNGMESLINVPYLYGSPDGDKYRDQNNQGLNHENRSEKIRVLASGDQDKILRYYTDLYFTRLARRERLKPDNALG